LEIHGLLQPHIVLSNNFPFFFNSLKLTNTFCLFRFGETNTFSIRAGSSFHAEGGIVIPVAEIITHPEYNHFTEEYDIALLRLEESIIFDSTKMPVGYIMHGGIIADGAMATVLGWGETRNENESSDHLRVVNVPIINQEVCSAIYDFFGGITDAMICAGNLDGGAGFCQGDNGGPLLVGNILGGIVSWSYDCAQPGFPGVYTRISHVAPWILEVSGVPHGCC